jgi:hypothetical protein
LTGRTTSAGGSVGGAHPAASNTANNEEANAEPLDLGLVMIHLHRRW